MNVQCDPICWSPWVMHYHRDKDTGEINFPSVQYFVINYMPKLYNICIKCNVSIITKYVVIDNQIYTNNVKCMYKIKIKYTSTL